eukprot:5001982-Prymnesium_polylepis.1
MAPIDWKGVPYWGVCAILGRVCHIGACGYMAPIDWNRVTLLRSLKTACSRPLACRANQGSIKGQSRVNQGSIKGQSRSIKGQPRGTQGGRALALSPAPPAPRSARTPSRAPRDVARDLARAIARDLIRDLARDLARDLIRDLA